MAMQGKQVLSNSRQTQIKVWLHQATDEDGEAGYHAWVLPYLGFATWAETECSVLEQVPHKLLEYLQFCQRRGVPFRDVSVPSKVGVVERVAGNETLFGWDYRPATPSFIDETIALLDATRSELLEVVTELPDGIFDWDPPYRHFPSWARWRTIRQILAHIANTETHYYLPNIGIQPTISPTLDEDAPWQKDLIQHREETLEALRNLKKARDLSRIRFDDNGAWSVRKVLRRLVWHERLHTKSISRIIKTYQAQHA